MSQPTHRPAADMALGDLVTIGGPDLIGVVTDAGPDGFVTVELCCHPSLVRLVDPAALPGLVIR